MISIFRKIVIRTIMDVLEQDRRESNKPIIKKHPSAVSIADFVRCGNKIM